MLLAVWQHKNCTVWHILRIQRNMSIYLPFWKIFLGKVTSSILISHLNSRKGEILSQYQYRHNAIFSSSFQLIWQKGIFPCLRFIISMLWWRIGTWRHLLKIFGKASEELIFVWEFQKKNLYLKSKLKPVCLKI